MSKDPIGFAGGTTNLYEAMRNNPLRYTDPLGLAPGDQFSTPNQAGYDAINYINPASIVLGQEFAGTVYQNQNGTYSATSPNGGTLAGSSHGPIEPNTVGLYHTHGANDPGYFNEYYSPRDVNNAIQFGIPSYLGTPSNSTFALNPSTGQIQKLGPQAGSSCSR